MKVDYDTIAPFAIMKKELEMIRDKMSKSKDDKEKGILTFIAKCILEELKEFEIKK